MKVTVDFVTEFLGLELFPELSLGLYLEYGSFFPVDVDQEGLSCCAWMLKAVSFSIFPV